MFSCIELGLNKKIDTGQMLFKSFSIGSYPNFTIWRTGVASVSGLDGSMCVIIMILVIIDNICLLRLRWEEKILKLCKHEEIKNPGLRAGVSIFKFPFSITN